MTTEPLLRVSSIEVEGLFDLYDHRVDLKLDDRVTILHGPNGVGKTMLLRMTNDMAQGGWWLFGRVPFRRFALRFSDESMLELTRASSDGDAHPHFTLRRYDAGEAAPAHESPLMPIPWIANPRHLTERGQLPAVRLPLGAPPAAPPPPVPDDKWIKATLKRISVHLISHDRLLRFDAGAPATAVADDNPTPAVSADAADLADRIEQAMGEFGRVSQRLDQSLPQRMLKQQAAVLSKADLAQALSDIAGTRDDLAALGLLDTADLEPVDVAALDDGDLKFLSLYVRDTADKLDALKGLAERVALFLDIVNGKLVDKRVRIDREAGLLVERDDGKRIALGSLSAGEQHELVMHYDLLFRVRPQTLVLIDEPELSLHVAWQDRFVSDLSRILAIADLDALIATHSPYIVGDRSDLMIPLHAESA